MTTANPQLLLPVGTQVVTRSEITGQNGELLCRRGVIGTIVSTPSGHSQEYVVRFPDEREITLQRQELTLRRHFQEAYLLSSTERIDSQQLYQYVIYRCIVGSRAYGLDDTGSDTDRRGFYLPPADLHWSLSGVPEQLENHDTQECYWELQKFLVLALKANPNILECLYTPLVEFITPLAQELLDLRLRLLSRLVYQNYNGYVMSQFKKLEQDLRNAGTVRWKHAMHLIRLLMSGVTVLREGDVPVRVDSHRETLLSIRRGEMAWDEVNRLRLSLHKEFDAAFATTTLPEFPDYTAANAFLIKARRAMVEGEIHS
jgi:predicted nucleotidyltransferase